MGLLDAYQDSTDTALRVMAARPLEPEQPKPKHSAWSAVPRAVAGAALEVAGNVMDTAGAFGQVAAAAGGIGPGFDPDAGKNRAQADLQLDKLKTEGINWRTDEAQPHYEFARDLRPDPLTAGTAENIVFGLTKGLTKAVGVAVALGPAAGATVFGASEGMTAADDLAEQGVDEASRAKVGAVTAAMNTIGVALPLVGNTLAKTATLVAVGGPGSFIAQQAATREILRSADYGKLAEQYDPLDPVGLTVATLVPAGFAAVAMRGARGGTKAGIGETKPAESGTPAPETVAASQDAVDAAMVQNLTAARDLHGAVSELDALARADMPPATDAAPARPAAGLGAAETNPASKAPETLDAYRAKLDQLVTEAPDLVARLDDAGQPVRLADEIAAIRRSAQEGSETEFGALDAPLLQVAAECAIVTGTAAL